MTKLRNLLVLAVAIATVTFTSCSKSGSADADAAQATADSLAAAQEMADSIAMADSLAAATSDSTGATAGSTTGAATWSSDLDKWVLSGTGSKVITLSGIAGEGELSAEGKSQLDLIASILEKNPTLKAVIQGHSADGGKPALEKTGSKARAVWTKTKLVFGRDAVAKNIETEGMGATQPLSGVDPKDESNKRITVSFTK